MPHVHGEISPPNPQASNLAKQEDEEENVVLEGKVNSTPAEIRGMDENILTPAGPGRDMEKEYDNKEEKTQEEGDSGAEVLDESESDDGTAGVSQDEQPVNGREVPKKLPNALPAFLLAEIKTYILMEADYNKLNKLENATVGRLEVAQARFEYSRERYLAARNLRLRADSLTDEEIEEQGLRSLLEELFG